MQPKSKNYVNIPRDVEDPFWRYQMPAMKTEIQGKNQNTVTVLSNLSQVAASLQTDPRWLLKFFCISLNTREVPSKSASTKIFALRGLLPLSQLNPILDQFIALLLLCSSCHLPEITIVSGSNWVRQDCRACGGTHKLDPSLKIVHYIGAQLQSGKATKSAAKRKEDQDLDYFESSLKSNPLTQSLCREGIAGDQ